MRLALTELRAAPDPHRGLARATEALTSRLRGSAIAILLADADGLRVAAASTDSLHALRCVDVACADGPASNAHRTGLPQRWQRTAHASGAFEPVARSAGFRSAYGLPIADASTRRGALLVLSSRARPLSHETLQQLRALADAIAEALAHDDTPAAAASWPADRPQHQHQPRRDPLA